MITLIYLKGKLYYSCDVDHSISELEFIDKSIQFLKVKKQELENLKKLIPFE